MSLWIRTAAAIVSLLGLVSALRAKPVGVCCDAATCACTVGATPDSCLSPNRFIDGGACTPSSCFGACCDATTCACTAATSTLSCIFPKTFICGAACASAPCMGWCYEPFSGSCTQTTQANCEGTFNCLGCIICNTACCDYSSGACMVTTACTCPPGTFRPMRAPCFATPSPCGACCDAPNGTCVPIQPAIGCPSGTTFIPSTSAEYICCSCPYSLDSSFPCSTPCNQIGACCHGTVCSISLPADCSGTFQGAGLPCGPPGNPTTCCPANVDGHNGLAVLDVFEFLNRWLTAIPSADFNHDGALTLVDISDMIAAWFMGC